MKKLLSLILILTLAVSILTSCNLFAPDENSDPSGDSQDTSTIIRVAYMSGPTGMGMAKMIHDDSDKYEFIAYSDASLATADLVTGKIDVACLPTNTAATVYNKQNAAVQVLALNCLNSLFIMTKTGTTIENLSDLEGKTIYTIKNGTPAVILTHLLKEAKVNATVKTSIGEGNDEKVITAPTDLAPLLITGKVDIALVPEPVATSAPLTIKSQNKDYNYSVAINLTEAWAEISDSPVAMGCIVANKSFANSNKTALNAFLAEYEQSVDFVSSPDNIDTAAQYIADAKILGAVPAAKKSLTNLGNAITYIDGDEMKNILVEFYNTIGVSLIGGKLPEDEFYYKK